MLPRSGRNVNFSPIQSPRGTSVAMLFPMEGQTCQNLSQNLPVAWGSTKRHVPVERQRVHFDVLDAHCGGEITAAEYRKGFDMIDQNKDGVITELELNSVCSVAFQLLDKDNDGKISRSEWDAGFAAVDMDGNGKITKSEVSDLC
jgi:hypothetical protein